MHRLTLLTGAMRTPHAYVIGAIESCAKNLYKDCYVVRSEACYMHVRSRWFYDWQSTNYDWV